MKTQYLRLATQVATHLPPALLNAGARTGGRLVYAAAGLPPDWCRRLPARVRPAFERLADQRQQGSINYAGLLGQPEDSAVVQQVCRAAFVGLATVYAEGPLMASPERLLSMTTVSGLAHVQSALALGRGAIIVSAHYGNWYLAAAAAAVRGYKLTVVADSIGHPELDEYLLELCQRIGIELLPIDNYVGMECRDRLRAGGLVALVSDLYQKGQSHVWVEQFGQLTQKPAGVGTLAERTFHGQISVNLGDDLSVPILPALCHRLEPNRYELRISPRVVYDYGRTRVADIVQMVTDCLNPALRCHPEQWTVLTPLWHDPTSMDRPPSHRISAAAAQRFFP